MVQFQFQIIDHGFLQTFLGSITHKNINEIKVIYVKTHNYDIKKKKKRRATHTLIKYSGIRPNSSTDGSRFDINL